MTGRLKVVSNGTVAGTSVTLDGEPLRGVSRIEFMIDGGLHRDQLVPIILHFESVDIELNTEPGLSV